MPVEEGKIEVKRDAVKEREKVSTENNLIEVAVKQSRGLTDKEKYKLLTTTQNDEIRDEDLNVKFFTTSDGKRKQIEFQKRWLTENSWLRYCAKEGLQGGWCLFRILFLTNSEKEPLGSFLKKPWLNYNKSKEHLEKHSSKEYHQRAGDRAYNFVKNYLNPQQRVDGRLTDVGDRNFNFNTSILPVIAEAVITCARQRVLLQGHKQDKINFDSPPLNNEGNFIAVLRLLAKNIPELKQHLTSGPRNARYTSKTVQNELIEIGADQIRDFYRECLKNSPHFAIIGDEVTSHGKEILSVCLRFLQVNDWNWDSESSTLANGLVNIFFSFQHTIVFMLAKELLEPIRPIAECLQGRLQEVYFGIQKVSEVKQHYQALREDVDKEHDRIYQKALLLTDKTGGEERMPRIIPGRQSRPNPEVQSPKDYW